MSIQEKLNKGHDRLNKAGNDADMLGLAITSIHGALEGACRDWLSAPQIKQQHGIDVQNKAEANWQNILELMPKHCGWSDRDVRYVRKMNSLRNKAAHGDGFESTRQDVEQYLSFVENAIAKGGTFSGSSSKTSTSSSYTGRYFPNNVAQGGVVKPFRFRIERSDHGVGISNCREASIICAANNDKSSIEKKGCLFFVMLFVLILVIYIIFITFLEFALGISDNIITKIQMFAVFGFLILPFVGSAIVGYKARPNLRVSVTITPDCIYIGKKSYSLPDGTNFRFISQAVPNLFVT